MSEQTRKLSRMLEAAGVSKTPVDEAQRALIADVRRELASARQDCPDLPVWLEERIENTIEIRGRYHLLKLRHEAFNEARGLPCWKCEADAKTCRKCGCVVD
jgi:hypothetical protein